LELEKGLYEEVLTELLTKQLGKMDERLSFEKKRLDEEESSYELSQYLQKVIFSVLARVPGKANERILNQISVCNKMIDTLKTAVSEPLFTDFEEYQISLDSELLLSVYEKIKYPKEGGDKLPRPEAPMNKSSIFTGASNTEPSLVNEWKKEIRSANKINLIVSFIRWSGAR